MISCAQPPSAELEQKRIETSHRSSLVHAALADSFFKNYETEYRRLLIEANEAEWLTNTHIVEGDDSNAKRNDAAKAALAAFVGSEKVIASCRDLLAKAADLPALQVRQLKAILYLAGDKPATAKELVAQRISAETRQTEALFGYTFKLDGKEVTTNQLDAILKDEKDVGKRQAAWEASKEVGATLKNGLADLQRLRNGTVRALGYSDFFDYQVSEYGMTTDEMVALNEKVVAQLRPLYRELHTWARHELAAKYGAPVPDMIPAHWLPNRWSQDWNALIEVEGVNLDAALKDKTPQWQVEQAERFYVSLGFPKLPASFYERSSLYPVPEGAAYKKNNHASAWHMDLDQDVRSLMSVESNSEWYETTHHELGHIYYYLCYSTPQVPLILRGGANRAYHEAVGTMMGLAAMQPRFMQAAGLADAKAPPLSDDAKRQLLLRDALNYVVFMPWSSGVMMRFEQELYGKELNKERWNARWWELVEKYQGVVPPAARGEEFCDAATKTHINDDAAQYYDYGLSFVLLFQLHDHIARNLLHEDPHDTNYFGRREVGDFLKQILAPGASVDWRALMRDSIGEELSAEPMLRYFEPLMAWLQEQNKGRRHTLADL
ncbi:MAG: peptidase [Planctomycetes bacterium]|nr:peptidase [Planctomycetota bacterium]